MLEGLLEFIMFNVESYCAVPPTVLFSAVFLFCLSVSMRSTYAFTSAYVKAGVGKRVRHYGKSGIWAVLKDMFMFGYFVFCI